MQKRSNFKDNLDSFLEAENSSKNKIDSENRIV